MCRPLIQARHHQGDQQRLRKLERRYSVEPGVGLQPLREHGLPKGGCHSIQPDEGGRAQSFLHRRGATAAGQPGHKQPSRRQPSLYVPAATARKYSYGAVE